MKRTSEELLGFYGLKVGDKVSFNGKVYDVVQHEADEDFVYLRQDNEQGTRTLISRIGDYEYTIIRIPQLTDDEKVILRNLDKEYKLIARDEDGDVCVFTNKPFRNKPFRETNYKVGNYWFDSMREDMRAFNHLFQFITWEDEPYEIKELLNE